MGEGTDQTQEFVATKSTTWRRRPGVTAAPAGMR
jgi:hypothetical protein